MAEAWKSAERVVDIQISLTKVDSPTYGTLTLTGPEHGFMNIVHSLVRIFSPRQGFYEGVMQSNDTGRYEGNDVTFDIDLDDDTSVLLGKEGQYLYLRDRAYDGSTLKLTYELETRIISAVPVDSTDGIMMLNVTLRLTDYTTLVA